jgi:hypothetical protein
MSDTLQQNWLGNPQQWAEQTFGRCALGDIRRTERLLKVAAAVATKPLSSISQICGKEVAATVGTYHWIENNLVDIRVVEEAGFMATARRCDQEQQEVLALIDGTTASFSHSVASELGTQGGGKALNISSTLAVCARDRQPLGLLDQDRWVRAAEAIETKESRRAYQEKESYQWQEATERFRQRVSCPDRVIVVCDREADTYDYLQYLQKSKQRFVIRAYHDRKLKNGKPLKEYMARRPVLGYYDVHEQQRGPQHARSGGQQERPGRPARTRRMAIRSAQGVLLRPPRGQKKPLRVNVVLAQEVEPPAGEKPLSWLLFTSEPVRTKQDALKVIGYYECRWLIEDFHKMMKSDGYCIEETRFTSVSTLERWLVIVAHAAARLLAVKQLGRTNPEAPCTEVLSTQEWQYLFFDSNPGQPIPDSPPPLSWAIPQIARLDGWQDSKGSGIPGPPSLWDGWHELRSRMVAWRQAWQVAWDFVQVFIWTWVWRFVFTLTWT